MIHMIYLGIAAIFIAILCATFIIHSGYEGGYDDFLVGAMVQILFIGSFCMIFVGFGIFKITWLYIGVALSFALLGIGYLAWRKPFSNPVRKEENRIRNKIQKTHQYKEYKNFVKVNGERIGAVMTDYNVLYAPKGTKLFSSGGKAWNPELGDPATHFFSDEEPGRGWQRQTFFQTGKGEYPWTEKEKPIILKMMIELLPVHGDAKWNIPGEAIRRLPR